MNENLKIYPVTEWFIRVDCENTLRLIRQVRSGNTDFLSRLIKEGIWPGDENLRKRCCCFCEKLKIKYAPIYILLKHE